VKFLRLVFLAFLIFVGFLKVEAQDLLFSQYFNSPLTLNPAMTGYMRPEIRAGILQRNQWQQFGNPFITTAVFADYSMKIGANKGVTNDGTKTFNLGFLYLNDQLGNNSYRTQQFLGSVSYIIPFGTYYRHRIGFGAQVGFKSQRLNREKLVFYDQIDSYYNRNPDGRTGEPLDSAQSYVLNNVPTFNAGLHYSFQFTKRNSGIFSFSVSNINQPKQKFLALPGLNYPMRYFGMVGLYLQASSRIVVNPAFTYQFQQNAEEYNIGGTVAIQMNSTSSKSGLDNPFRVVLYLGSYYRLRDAYIPYVGLRYGSFTGGVSYDINLNSLSNSTLAGTGRSKPKSLEISLVYSGFFDSKTAYKYSLPWKDYFQ